MNKTRERIKGDPLNRHPQHLPFCVELSGRFIESVHNQAKAVFDFMKQNTNFHSDPGTYMANKDSWFTIEEKFPLIAKFKIHFSMTNTMIFLEFDKPGESYSHRPHTHNTKTGTGLFLTIKDSIGAGTAFYRPKQENVDCVRYILDDGTIFEAEDCYDTQPIEVVQMSKPHAIALNAFHSPYEIIENYPDNYKRVTMNWSSNMEFLDFANKVNLDEIFSE